VAKIIFDTNILIEILKGNHQTIQTIQTVESFEVLCISEVTAMELYYGARDKKELMKLKKFINLFEILHIDTNISKLASKLVFEYAKSHTLNIPDSLIAATTIVHNHPLFTYNKKDFKFFRN